MSLDIRARRLLERTIKRFEKKRQDAEDAYVAKHIQHETLNCRHHGMPHGDRFRCRIKCVGDNEFEAATCCDAKARGCDSFGLIRSVEGLRRDFQNLSPEDLNARWPSLAAYRWIVQELTLLLAEDHDAPHPE